MYVMWVKLLFDDDESVLGLDSLCLILMRRCVLSCDLTHLHEVVHHASSTVAQVYHVEIILHVESAQCR
jgi:hypothetical protein